MKRLEGRVALISGTARGQCRAAALRFAAEGALAVGGDLLHEEALETQRLIAREGGTILTPGRLDVTDAESVRSWMAEAVDAFGGIDIVHADAGTVRFGAIDGRPYGDCAAAPRAGLDSVRLTVRAAWPHLIASHGRILTVGSTADRGTPWPSRAPRPRRCRGAVPYRGASFEACGSMATCRPTASGDGATAGRGAAPSGRSPCK
ncbi:SDR family NAD(P)-dependent oxidoreductase [Streptomyces cinerochromogenes]|uniref:SDR family NAD(P)-dependent oxidoreductase n=1 Tax=Streptomyces cinerochromogenes TaxID=66422 RepID=UPI00339EBA2C